LIGAPDALRPRINDQIALRYRRIATAGALKLGRRCLAIRQMDFPLDLCLSAGDLAYLRDHTRSILGIFVDAKTRALALDPLLLILVRARLGRGVVGFPEHGRNPGRFRADKKVIRAIAHACNPDGWMDAIGDGHWRPP